MTQLACYGEIELRFPDATRSIGLCLTALFLRHCWSYLQQVIYGFNLV
jgi:hypothetical protein